MSFDLHERIQTLKPLASPLDFRLADVARVVENLSLQIRDIYAVVIDHSDSPHSGGGEVQRRRRSQTSGTDQQHARRADLLLTRRADLSQSQVPAVANFF